MLKNFSILFFLITTLNFQGICMPHSYPGLLCTIKVIVQQIFELLQQKFLEKEHATI